jgi:hypothetical protein
MMAFLASFFQPAAEDVRTYDFAPLPAEEKLKPSKEAEAAAERLIDSMMFGRAGAGASGSAGAVGASPSASADAFAATGDPRTVYNPTLRCVGVSMRACVHDVCFAFCVS